MQCIARKSPVKVCEIKHISNREPKFHYDEIFEGAGLPVAAKSSYWKINMVEVKYENLLEMSFI